MLILSFCFLYGPRAFAMLASTHTRAFQVWKTAELEVAKFKDVVGQKVFQVCFNQFQVRGGSGWIGAGYVDGREKSSRKWLEKPQKSAK